MIQHTVPAPGNLGAGLITVQEGSSVDLDLSLEAVHEGIFVSGAAHVTGTGECSRCLDPLERDFEIDIQEMFFFEAPEPARNREEEFEDEQRLIEDEMINLEPALRDAVVIALPFQPVCREDCPGLCSECGVRMADHPGHHHEVADLRWEALRGLAEDPEQK